MPYATADQLRVTREISGVRARRRDRSLANVPQFASTTPANTIYEPLWISMDTDVDNSEYNFAPSRGFAEIGTFHVRRDWYSGAVQEGWYGFIGDNDRDQRPLFGSDSCYEELGNPGYCWLFQYPSESSRVSAVMGNTHVFEISRKGFGLLQPFSAFQSWAGKLDDRAVWPEDSDRWEWRIDGSLFASFVWRNAFPDRWAAGLEISSQADSDVPCESIVQTFEVRVDSYDANGNQRRQWYPAAQLAEFSSTFRDAGMCSYLVSDRDWTLYTSQVVPCP